METLLSSFEKMVCKPEQVEEATAFCVVRDFSGSSHNVKVSLEAPSTMTGKEFVQKVAKLFNFDPCSFRLVSPIPRSNNQYRGVLSEHTEELLKDAGVNYGDGTRNLFIVEGLNGDNPRPPDKYDDLELGASASPDESPSFNSNEAPVPPPMPSENDYKITFSSYECSANRRRLINYVDRPSHVSRIGSTDSPYTIGYRGLVNQAMTCYLNSLLQALFMTPEFRNALYNWKFVSASGIDESKSIPYQLQKLFLNLQTSHRIAIETTDLTRSFGWDSSEAWQQHDIQELCRVMFDALEHEFKGTEQADLINRLYQGRMIDYVKCLECGIEKSREDTFLDIPLPVRPFGCSSAYGSVEEALRAFVEPEMLDGNNQYFCEKCNKKCNAHKGLKFQKFPYLLTLHLLRFDFDYNTMHRIKLSDKVEFPDNLNLNSFVPLANLTSSNMYKEEGSEGFPEEMTGSSSKCDDSSTTGSGSAIDDECSMIPSNDLNNVDSDQDIDEGIDVGQQHEKKNRNRSIETGPYVYDLFAIMVHSGSASGGHYYVYIKDFNTNDWFCFNDQTVTRITNEDIDRSYGGYEGYSKGYYASPYSSSMNAYMLMYRQIDRERNVVPLKEHEFPSHIKKLLREMEEKADNEKRLRDLEKETRKFKVCVHHPSLHKIVETKIDCHINTTLKELTQITYKKLQLENEVPLDLCRLVLYNSRTDTIENSLAGKENESICFLKPSYAFRKIEMLLEIRQPNKSFTSYNPGAVSIRIFVVDVDSERINGPQKMRTSLTNLMSTFRDELYETFDYPRSNFLLLFLEQPDWGVEKSLEDESMSLDEAHVKPNSRIFICSKKTDDRKTVYRHKMQLLVQRFLNTISLEIILPEVKPNVFRTLSIPPLSDYKNSQVHVFNTINKSVLMPKAQAPDTTLPETDADVIADLFYASSISSADGPRSDQSASEESSLTDSDRTLTVENQDYQMSSPSTPTQICDNGYSKHLISDEENSNNTANLINELNSVGNLLEAQEYYFKELSYNASIDKRNLKIEVDKRMPLNVFKNHLEQYVQAPSPYFKLYLDSVSQSDNCWSSDTYVSSLHKVADNARLMVRLGRPLKPGITKGQIFHLDLNSKKLIKLFGEFELNGEGTVAETKKEILQELTMYQNVDISFDRCRLRLRDNDGPGKICPNERKWKELLNQEPYVQLLMQALDTEAPEVNSETQMIIFILHYDSATENTNRVQEIVIDEPSVMKLKEKICEISNIPVENIVLGHLSWSNYLSQRDSLSDDIYTSKTDITWDGFNNSTPLTEWPNPLEDENCIVYYKDNRGELSDMENGEMFSRNSSSLMYSNKCEKSLKIIRVNNSSPVIMHYDEIASAQMQ